MPLLLSRILDRISLYVLHRYLLAPPAEVVIVDIDSKYYASSPLNICMIASPSDK